MKRNNKKLKILVSIFLLLASVTLKAQQTKISGVLTGKAASYVKQVGFYYDGHRSAVKCKGTQFDTILNIKESQFLELNIGSNTKEYIYVVPGEEIKLNINKETLNESDIIIDNKNLQLLNNVKNLFFESIKNEGISTTSNKWASSFLYGKEDIVEKAITTALGFYDDNSKKIKKIAPDFKGDFMFFYEAFKKYIDIEHSFLKDIESQLADISNSELNITVLTIPYYSAYLVDLTNAYAAHKLKNYGLRLEIMTSGHIYKTIAAEALVQNIHNQGIVDYLFFDKINNELLVNGVKNHNYVSYLMDNSGENIKKAFAKKYEELLAKQASNQDTKERVDAFNFELYDADGKKYVLEDFKGKMLFIDFWASWCAPCKGQIPHIKELEKYYSGKDIVFASVSLDETKEAWLEAVEVEKLHGTVLYAQGAFKNPFPKYYNVNSIPRFMLIDNEGKIISDAMPRPQEQNIVKSMIDKELYKKEANEVLKKHLAAIGSDIIENNGLIMNGTQSIMGININFKIVYSYPSSLRYDTKVVENELYVMSVGKDFFKPKYAIIKGNKFNGNIANIEPKTLFTFLRGFEVFYLSKVKNYNFEFAEENFTNTDNQYVLQTILDGNSHTFYINKSDYLLSKYTYENEAKPSEGGGYLEITNKYSEYKNVEGVMIPQNVLSNGMINLKIKEAEVKPIAPEVFNIQ